MEDYTRTVYLMKDRQERFNMKRAWFVNAYRVVNERKEDQVQPWFNTKTEARAFCKHQNWKLIERNV